VSGGGGGVFAPLRVAPTEWLVYLRIQKTGSQTFWATLQKEFRADVWRGSGQCPDRSFCGGKGYKARAWPKGGGRGDVRAFSLTRCADTQPPSHCTTLARSHFLSIALFMSLCFTFPQFSIHVARLLPFCARATRAKTWCTKTQRTS
jgi:hypothetical protein